MKKNSDKALYSKIFDWIANSISFKAMRKGMMLTIPFLLIGSFCLLMMSWPVPAVNEFIKGLAGGVVYKFLQLVYNTTMGAMVIPIIIGVSYSYARMLRSEYTGYYVISSLLNFVIFTTPSNLSFSFEIFNTVYVFTAMLVTMFTCGILRMLFQWLAKVSKKNYYSGLDLELQSSMQAIVPVTVTVLMVLLIRVVFNDMLHFDVNNFGAMLTGYMFKHLGTGLLGATVYIILIHLLWFFGIHGDNMLSYVSYFMFEAGMAENISLISAGEPAAHMFTKTFFDAMILIGGSGTTLSLLIALLIGSKQKSHKKLFQFSIIPSLFNINEVVIFGLPIVFNPILIIPFILTPLILLYFDMLVMYIGLVPYVCHQITWTTPVFFSGYFSTGSIAGAILQAVNILIGVGIYLPFVRWSEKYSGKVLKDNIESIKNKVMECEKSGIPVNLNYEDNVGRYNVIRMLEKDLNRAILNDEIDVHYQPQICSDDSLYGVEALLRWNHPAVGYIYPPLVIALAEQINLLDKLGLMIIEKAAKTLEEISKHVDEPIHLSVNISPVQLDNPNFKQEVEKILKHYNFGKCILCFEVTEQIALALTGRAAEQMQQLRGMGIPFHMDDFGMGHSSMVYLQQNEFSVVKLDGNLVRDIVDNTRSLDIIHGIQKMAGPLNFVTIAEFVETKEQIELLRKLGCNIFQGWYYSKALPFDELKQYLIQNNLYVE